MKNAPLPPSSPPEYLEKYALACPPFENRIDRKFFYGGTALMQRLDLLAHLTQFGEPLVFVIGPPGSGKTTMLSQFAARANSRWYLCPLNPDSLDQLTTHLSTALGGADADSGVDVLLTRWDTETDASRLFVIAIDDADQLDADACRLLCELLDKPQGERIRVLLFGTAELQPLLKETLAKLASARTPQLLEVPRYSEEETAAYLMYRLAVAGYSGESPFSSIEVRAICKAADGWPGEINQFADQTLTEHVMRTRSRTARPQTNSHGNRKQLWLIAPVILVISLIYLGWQNLYSPASDAGDVNSDETRLALPDPQPPESAKQPDRAATLPAPVVATENISPERPMQEPPTLAENETSPAAPDTQPLADAIPLPLPEQEQEPAAPPPATAEVPLPEAPEALTMAPINPPQPVTVTSQPVEEAIAATTDQPPESTESSPAITPQPSAAPETAATGPHREAWLLEQPGQSFSLQLLGSRSEKLLNDFIRKHKLDPAQSAYYRGLHKGSDWFVLMYGIYPSRDAALQGLASLPETVRKSKPWPRTLEAVHQSVREANP